MKHSSFSPSFALYGGTLALCGGTRVWLKMRHINLETGFYSGGGLAVIVFNAMLGIGMALLLAHYLLRVSHRDYPVPRSSAAVSFTMSLLGVTVILFSLEMLGILLPVGASSMKMDTSAAAICGILGITGGAALFAVGVAGLLLRRSTGGFLPLISGVWMLVCLVCRFNSYPAPTTVSDNMLVVLFMVFGPMFLVGHARTMSAIARKDGRNYTIPTGFCASLCGLLAVLPNWIWMASNRTLQIPAPLLGPFESIFILTLSIYALVFIRHICAGIRAV